MPTVREILKEKGDLLYSISPDKTVFDAMKLMADKDIGALIVIEQDTPIGMFSERDYARKLILKGKFSKDTKIKDIMSSPIFTVDPEKTIESCMELMTNKHIRHLPVLENDKLIGLISIGDVVNSIISHQSFLIKEFQNYVSGSSQ